MQQFYARILFLAGVNVLFVCVIYYTPLITSNSKSPISEDVYNISKNELNLLRHTVCMLPRGRLGNQLCEYAHLLLINDSYSVNIAVSSSMRNNLAEIFPNLTVKQECSQLVTKKSRKKKKTVGYPEVLGALNKSTPGSVFTVSATPCDLEQISRGRKLWQQDFSVPNELKTHAAGRLRALTLRWAAKCASGCSPDNLTLVGVQVRRGDYTNVLRRHHVEDEKLLPFQYYRAAFELYRSRFKNVLFVVVTEPGEYEWCRRNLIGKARDVVLADDKCSAGQDLVLLSSFDHIIYSHGTFGAWGILLTPKVTVAYPQPGDDRGGQRYMLYSAFDQIREQTNETEYMQVKFNKNG